MLARNYYNLPTYISVCPSRIATNVINIDSGIRMIRFLTTDDDLKVNSIIKLIGVSCTYLSDANNSAHPIVPQFNYLFNCPQLSHLR